MPFLGAKNGKSVREGTLFRRESDYVLPITRIIEIEIIAPQIIIILGFLPDKCGRGQACVIAYGPNG